MVRKSDHNQMRKVKIKLSAPGEILRGEVVVEVDSNSTWENVLRDEQAKMPKNTENYRISTHFEKFHVLLTQTVYDFISKFKKKRPVHVARLIKIRSNSPDRRRHPQRKSTTSNRAGSREALPPISTEERSGESASGYGNEPSPERNGEFVTNEPNNTQRAEEMNGHETFRRDLIERFEQNSNDNLLLLRQELLEIQCDLDLRESIKARWPRQYNYLQGLFLNPEVSGEAADAEAEDNYQPEEIEMWADGSISAKTPYAVRTQELISQGIDYENIKPELVARFSKKDIRNLCLVGKEFRETQGNFDLMEKMEAKWPRSLQHLQELYG